MKPPKTISRQNEGLLIDWQDGHQELIPARKLRLACPCAACVEEMTGRPILDPNSVPLDIIPVEISLVGAYGIRVRWSDSHQTGIYTFGMLWELCSGGGSDRS